MNALHSQITPEVHAYLLEGVWEHTKEEIEGAIASVFKITLKGNSDVIRVDSTVLGIDDARFIATFQSRRSASGGNKVVVLACQSMTREAQNALLKVFEEPTPNTYFFIVTASVRALLPTLRSRLFELTHHIEQHTSGQAKVFLSAPPSERLKILEQVIQTKDTASAQALLDGILDEIYVSASGKPGGLGEFSVLYALEEIIRARQYLGARGSSIKLLLEHVALVVPSSGLQ